FSSGRMCMQLMQQYVQKSSRTNLPLRSFLMVSGLLLSQVSFSENSGTSIRRGKGFGRLPAALALGGGAAAGTSAEPPPTGGSAAAWFSPARSDSPDSAGDEATGCCAIRG